MRLNRKQRLLIALLIFLIIAGGIYFLDYSNRPKNFNVILITLDALRPNHMGYYGYKKETTPFLDHFSKNAFIFTNVIAQSASTVPSISSMFTSRYPYSDYVVDSSYHLGNEHITIAEFLKGKGYDTFGIVGHYYVKKKYGFSRGFNYFDDNFDIYRTANETLKSVIDLLKKINKNKKFFLWIHFREPHFPRTPPDKYIDFFSEPFKGHSGKKTYTISGEQRILSDKQIYEETVAYDANIRFVDDNLRNLFEYLSKTDLIKKSIIIITADHGESLGEHNIFDHNELYYGIIRVPLIVKIPYFKRGIISYPVSSVDIFPTILDLLGYKNDRLKLNLRGENLFLDRGSDEIQISEYPDRYSLINNNWRIFLNKGGNYYLYNLKDDPQELNNLVSVEKEKFEFMKQKLINFMKKQALHREIDPWQSLDGQSKERLRSLGYVQ